MNQLGFSFSAIVAPTTNGPESLQSQLRKLLNPYVVVKLTKNVSTMISTRRRGRVLYIRVHSMFNEAPTEIIEALARFVSKNHIPKKEGQVLDQWIEDHRGIIAAQRTDEAIQPIGEHHDLSILFDRLNNKYFEGRIRARTTWSLAAKHTRAKKQSRHSIQMGSYSEELQLIRIHPALDQKWVPRYFVEFVVYHEMLHQVHPRRDKGQSGCTVHTPAFRRDEQKFEQMEKVKQFESLHLNRLLKY